MPATPEDTNTTLVEQFCSAEVYAHNLKVDFSKHVKRDTNRGVDYIPWHRLYAFMCVYTPFRINETKWVDIDPSDPSRGTLAVVTLVNITNGVVSVPLYNAVMAKNRMNSSVSDADARQIADAIQRCMVKAVAIHTGLGLEMWMKLEEDEDIEPLEDDEDEDDDEEDEEPVPRRTRRTATTTNATRSRRSRRG